MYNISLCGIVTMGPPNNEYMLIKKLMEKELHTYLPAGPLFPFDLGHFSPESYMVSSHLAGRRTLAKVTCQ
jgi:hypothetical protein